VNRLALAWPGIALTITVIDDLVAGPVLAFGGIVLGPRIGIPIGMVVFTCLMLALAWSALVASRNIDPSTGARIEDLAQRAANHRLAGRFVRRVGDEHPLPTALVAAIISPVFVVLWARLVHPAELLHRTVIIAAVAYGLGFSLFYAASVSLIGLAIQGS
jgi:hypothetical protein